jgi:hypothetical protein
LWVTDSAVSEGHSNSVSVPTNFDVGISETKDDEQLKLKKDFSTGLQNNGIINQILKMSTTLFWAMIEQHIIFYAGTRPTFTTGRTET